MDKKEIERKSDYFDVEKYRVERFTASVVLLILTVFSFIIFAIFFSSLNIDLNPENDQIPGASILAVIFVGAAFAILGLIVFAFAFLFSFIGFCLGYSSIKHLPTKRMTVCAKIVSFIHLGVLIIIALLALQTFVF